MGRKKYVHYDWDDDLNNGEGGFTERPYTWREIVKAKIQERGRRIAEWLGLNGHTGMPGPMGPMGDRGQKGDVCMATDQELRKLFLDDCPANARAREALKEAVRQLIQEDPSILSIEKP